MKKVTVIALMLALTAALLTACRNPMTDEVPNESTRPTTAPTTTAPTTTAPTTTAPTTTAPTTTAPSTTSPTEGSSATENTTNSREARMPGM